MLKKNIDVLEAESVILATYRAFSQNQCSKQPPLLGIMPLRAVYCDWRKYGSCWNTAGIMRIKTQFVLFETSQYVRRYECLKPEQKICIRFSWLNSHLDSRIYIVIIRIIIFRKYYSINVNIRIVAQLIDHSRRYTRSLQIKQTAF